MNKVCLSGADIYMAVVMIVVAVFVITTILLRKYYLPDDE